MRRFGEFPIIAVVKYDRGNGLFLGMEDHLFMYVDKCVDGILFVCGEHFGSTCMIVLPLKYYDIRR